MLKSWKDYEYVNQSGCNSISGVDDSKKFDALRLALNVLQVSTENTEAIFSVIAGILWLGNLRFQVCISEDNILKKLFYSHHNLIL